MARLKTCPVPPPQTLCTLRDAANFKAVDSAGFGGPRHHTIREPTPLRLILTNLTLRKDMHTEQCRNIVNCLRARVKVQKLIEGQVVVAEEEVEVGVEEMGGGVMVEVDVVVVSLGVVEVG